MKIVQSKVNQIQIPAEFNSMAWHPLSWTQKEAKQIPLYPDTGALESAFTRLRSLPPLITSWEIEALKKKLALAGRGQAFVLQGGDCAETFEGCTSPKIVNLMKVMIQVSFILLHETQKPILRIGRVAGQYAKPRSKETEVVNGQEMLTYRGDLVHSIEETTEARTPDPERMIEAYTRSALTLNFLRALSDEGFADLNHPEYWELGFMKNNEFYDEYEGIIQNINKAISFMDAVTEQPLITLQRLDLYSSHEALHLFYDAAQTRRVPRKQGWYNLSSHMVWLGNRTRDPEGAHVEYLRGIENPIGVKVDASITKDELARLLERLNPEREEGKIMLISRLGADQTEEHLPALIRTARATGQPVVWSCDPMHGNTFLAGKVKTRRFEDIEREISAAFDVHDAEGSILGGVHLEMTGDNVTECVGGVSGLNEEGLLQTYETYCDPRLNYEQSLELAFLIARKVRG